MHTRIGLFAMIALAAVEVLAAENPSCSFLPCPGVNIHERPLKNPGKDTTPSPSDISQPSSPSSINTSESSSPSSTGSSHPVYDTPTSTHVEPIPTQAYPTTKKPAASHPKCSGLPIPDWVLVHTPDLACPNKLKGGDVKDFWHRIEHKFEEFESHFDPFDKF